MHTPVIVQEHPYYAVTNEVGDFKIPWIPEGIYTLSVWHEVLGELRQEVSPESTFPILTYPSQSTD